MSSHSIFKDVFSNHFCKEVMHHSYQYVEAAQYEPVQKRLIELINEVQGYLKNSFPFEYNFIGSCARGMITIDPTTNTGYDFDLNIRFENYQKYTAKQLKTTLMDAFNRFVLKYGYDYCEDSTRVITIKVKDHNNSKIVHSADFCIVADLPNNRMKIVKNDKKVGSYHWQVLGQYPQELFDRADYLRDHLLWDKVKKLYLQKKNANIDPNVKSRSIYSMTINELYANPNKII